MALSRRSFFGAMATPVIAPVVLRLPQGTAPDVPKLPAHGDRVDVEFVLLGDGRGKTGHVVASKVVPSIVNAQAGWLEFAEDITEVTFGEVTSDVAITAWAIRSDAWRILGYIRGDQVFGSVVPNGGNITLQFGGRAYARFA